MFTLVHFHFRPGSEATQYTSFTLTETATLVHLGLRSFSLLVISLGRQSGKFPPQQLCFCRKLRRHPNIQVLYFLVNQL